MKILFLLSSLEPAGSETSCLELAKAWGDRHEVFWISDRLHFGQRYTSYPIHQKAVPGGILNTLRVLRFIRRNRVELIHSHSRRSHWVAAQAAALAKIPHVATIHQPPPVHLFSRLFPCLGDHTIVIDEAIQDHLNTHFRRGIRRMSLIRNGIDLSRYPVSPQELRAAGPDKRILVLGRLSGGRWRAVKFFLSVLQRIGRTLPKACFQLVGRLPSELKGELEDLLKRVNGAIHPSFVETHDFVPDLAPLLAGCDGVIAGGRSALESLAAGKPVIALGEKGVIGLCDDEIWPEAMRTNLGDHPGGSADSFYPAKLEWGLRQLTGNDAAQQKLGVWGRAQVEKYYNIQTVAREVEKVYESLLTSANLPAAR